MMHPRPPLPYAPFPPTHPPLPCSNMLEVQQWIVAINQAAAIYSNAPLASAVGSQSKFVRPMYPMKPANSDNVRGCGQSGEREEDGYEERERREGEGREELRGGGEKKLDMVLG